MFTYGDRDLDTICAVASAPGYGGISVIRISGPRAFEITRKLSPKFPDKPESHRAYFSGIFDPQKNEQIDEGILLCFVKGKSYTGDETVEISCHGNPVICEKIISALVACGARTAIAGEFTYRAFSNGSIDLVQAESVLSLIQSESENSLRQSLRQLRGDLSSQINEFESEIIWALAHIVADIDFSTENLAVADIDEIQTRLGAVQNRMQELIDSYSQGRQLKDGVQVLILGVPNAGKSSLLNALAQENRAIVSAIAGTTRDLVDIRILDQGQKWIITDSAGLRENAEQIERIGISKTEEAITSSDRLVFVLDVTQNIPQQLELLKNHQNLQKKWLLFVNKMDQAPKGIEKTIESALIDCKIFLNADAAMEFLKHRAIFSSALDITSRRQILDLLGSLERSTERVGNQNLLMVARHKESLSAAVKNLTNGMRILREEKSEELAAFELQECLRSLQEVLGKVFDDQILDRVFKEFCIGK